MSISTSAKLKVEIIDHTALITIDNPGANTWDTESLPALAQLIDTLNAGAPTACRQLVSGTISLP